MINITLSSSSDISKEEISDIAAAIVCNFQFYFGFDIKVDDKSVTEIIDHCDCETLEQRIDAICEKTEISIKLE